MTLYLYKTKFNSPNSLTATAASEVSTSLLYFCVEKPRETTLNFIDK